jgi:phytol kinase
VGWIADIVGRNVNSPSCLSRERALRVVSVFIGGWLLTMFIFAIYVWMGAFSGPVTRFLLSVTWIAIGATLVESLPFKDVDNITVVLISVLIGHLVFNRTLQGLQAFAGLG